MDVASEKALTLSDQLQSLWPRIFGCSPRYVAPGNKFLRTPNEKAAPKKETAKSTYPMDHLACSTVLVANKSYKEAHVKQKYCNKEPLLDEIKSPNITIAPVRAFIIDSEVN